jgi:hypothetical protein
MADYSSFYFSLHGSSPDFLPERIRLGDKTTRYSTDITLEEIFSVGYTGPIEIPDYNKETECLVWNSSTLKFTVNKITQEQLDIVEDKEVRADIQKRITEITKKFEEAVTSLYVSAANNYIAVLSSLLERSTLLSRKDVPDFNFNGFTYVADSQAAVTRWLEEASAYIEPSLWYKTFGFIPNFPPDLVGYFTVPSGWTQEIDTSTLWTSIPSSGTMLPSLSGYNTVTNESTYSLTTGEPVPLIQHSVFFPQ